MSTTTSTPQTLVGKLIAIVVGIFHKADPIIDQFALWADNLINKVKILEASDVGQFIEKEIEDFIPASTGLIDAFKLWLPKVAGIITAGKVEADKTDAQKLTDLVTYLGTLKIADPVLYAGILNTLNASVQQFYSTNGGVVLPVSQSLAIAQVVHDPTLSN